MSIADVRRRARDHAVGHLATRGLDPDALHDLLEPGDGGQFVLAGSTTEGLANEESDIDVVAIGETVPRAQILVHEDSYDASVARRGDHEINVEVRPPDNLRQLADRITNTLRCIHDIEAARREDRLEFDIIRHDDLRLLHRLRWGVPLGGSEAFDLWTEELNLAELPLYVATISLFEHYVLREDVIAQVSRSDHAALRMLQLATDNLVQAVVATCGETNPAAKWRTTVLDRSAGSLPAGCRDRLLELLFVRPGDGAVAEIVEAAVTYADELIGEVVLAAFPEMIPALLELDQVFDMPKQLA